MERVEHSVVINRPAKEVFAFMTDIEKQALWVGPVSESRQTSEGPLAVGTTYTQMAQMLGRQAELDYEVTEYEPNRKFSSKTTSGPVEIQNTFTLEAADGGTKVNLAAAVEAGGFFRLAEPIFVRTVKRQVATDLGTMKDFLEGQA